MKQRIGNFEISTLDAGNYELSRISKNKKGEESLYNVGYFNKLDSAVREIAKRTADSVNGGLDEWLGKYRETVAEVKSMLM